MRVSMMRMLVGSALLPAIRLKLAMLLLRLLLADMIISLVNVVLAVLVDAALLVVAECESNESSGGWPILLATIDTMLLVVLVYGATMLAALSELDDDVELISLWMNFYTTQAHTHTHIENRLYSCWSIIKK